MIGWEVFKEIKTQNSVNAALRMQIVTKHFEAMQFDNEEFQGKAQKAIYASAS